MSLDPVSLEVIRSLLDEDTSLAQDLSTATDAGAMVARLCAAASVKGVQIDEAALVAYLQTPKGQTIGDTELDAVAGGFSVIAYSRLHPSESCKPAEGSWNGGAVPI